MIRITRPKPTLALCRSCRRKPGTNRVNVYSPSYDHGQYDGVTIYLCDNCLAKLGRRHTRKTPSRGPKR